jgi:large subunit ribosomal protein L10
MVLTKDQKKNLIDGIQDRVVKSKTLVFTNYQGLKVKDLNVLRKKLKEKGIEYKVIKNTLARLVFKNNDLKIEDTILDKPAAVAFGYKDEVEPSKIIHEFAKTNNKLEILGGIVNGEFMDVAAIKALALLPSREELYAKVVGSIAAPISGFVNVMSGNLRGLVSVLKQYQEKKA